MQSAAMIRVASANVVTMRDMEPLRCDAGAGKRKPRIIAATGVCVQAKPGRKPCASRGRASRGWNGTTPFKTRWRAGESELFGDVAQTRRVGATDDAERAT